MVTREGYEPDYSERVAYGHQLSDDRYLRDFVDFTVAGFLTVQHLVLEDGGQYPLGESRPHGTRSAYDVGSP